MKREKIIIAIDGYAACGKSTLAKQLASALNYAYLDTGAMYRSVTLFLLEENIDLKSTKEVEEALQRINLEFRWDSNHGRALIFLNGRNVDDEVRKPVVSEKVSEVASIGSVRSFLVRLQKKLGMPGGIAMDGRDIGTVVFPDAELKIYMTAVPEVRAHRRWEEFHEKHVEIEEEEVLRNTNERDRVDSSRTISPLKPADDAIILDNTFLTKDQQFEWAMNMVRVRIIQKAASPALA